ncbi:ABC transporter permease [Variovorax sp. H27-G14]|uniref:ABC transporter permease n=1 Tax=Variovorax sp. H27-G14 TaxID=3111914 RepID=UPI0038FCAA37
MNGALRSSLNRLGSLGVLLALVALWWVASNAGWVSRVFLPTPQATFASLLEGLNLAGDNARTGNGELFAFTQATVGRMIEGWLLASLFGVVLGAAIGVSPPVRAWVQPTLEFIRPLPASALLPLAIAIFGLNPGMVLFVVAFGAMWPVLLATVHGFAAVEPRLAEVARCLQISRAAYIWKMGLPNAMPDILAGMRLALTIALIVAVVGEMIASQSGLGQAILLAARAFRASELFAGIVLLGLIGFVSNALLAFAEQRLLRWQQP